MRGNKMQNDLFYIIDKNLIKKDIELAYNDRAITLNSVIDGRCNFYGIGKDILPILEKCKIKYILVNDLKEALEIRKYNNSVEIIIKHIENDYFGDAIVNNLIVTLYDYKELEKIKKLKLKDDIKVLLYIDSGDNIEGFKKLNEIKDYENEIKHLNIIGAYTDLNHDKKNKGFNNFEKITNCISKDSIKFIVSEKSYDTNTNYFSKNIYLNDMDNIVSLCANIKQLKLLDKNDVFLSKQLKRKKHFAIINTPFKIDVKKVLIKGKLYNLFKTFDNNLIDNIDSKVKLKNQVIILGGASKNSMKNKILINDIPKYYLEGTVLEEAKFL